MALGEGQRRALRIVGAALATTSSAFIVAYYANVAVADPPQSFWIPASYLALAVMAIGTVSFLVAEFGIPRWLYMPRRQKPILRQPVPPDEPEGEWLAYHPLVQDGQLRSTLRHSTNIPGRHVTHLKRCEVEVEGPTGTFQQVRSNPNGWDDRNGVYMVEYPRDFGAPPLMPGRHLVRWFGRAETGKFTGDLDKDFTQRIPIAILDVVVGADGWVSKA